MAEQQEYRVIADRDKGDDPQWGQVESGDRVWFSGPRDDVDRIERPVPTTNEPEFGWDACPSTAAHAAHEWNVNEGEVGFGSRCAGIAAPSLPTREQIAEVVAEANAVRGAYLSFWGAHSSNDIARVGREPSMPPTPAIDAWSLALLQKGGDRG